MFVQIGNKAINMDLVTEIYFDENSKAVELTLAVQDGDHPSFISLRAENAKRFLDWWDNKADVHKI